MEVFEGDNMIREYEKQNVYDAFQERMRLIFEEFDNIYGEITLYC